MWRLRNSFLRPAIYLFFLFSFFVFVPHALAQLTVIETAEDHFAKGRYDLSRGKYEEILKNPFASPADISVSQCRIGVIHSIQNSLVDARHMLEDSLKNQSLPAKHSAICHYALLQIYVLGKNDIEARDLVRRMGELQLSPVYQARAYAIAAEVGQHLGDNRFEIFYLQKLLETFKKSELAEVEVKSLKNKKLSVQDVLNRISIAKKEALGPQKALAPAVTLESAQSLQATTSVASDPTAEPLKSNVSNRSESVFEKSEGLGVAINSPMGQIFNFLKDGNVASAYAFASKIGDDQLQSSLASIGIGVSAARLVSRFSHIASEDPRNMRVGIILSSAGFFTRFNSRIMRSIASFSASSAARGVNFSFVVKGVSPDSGGADTAATELIFDDHVHAIIGPISNSQTLAALGIAKLFRVPIFALGPVVHAPELSSDALVRMGILARSQSLLLVKHIQSDLNLENVAIFAPNDAYGNEMAKAFSDVSKESKFPVQSVQYYSAAKDVLNDEVSAVIGPQDRESRKEEYEEILQAAKEKASKEKKKFDPKRVLLPPLLSYDALFVPEALAKSRMIASTFAYFGVENARMLGDRQWIEGAGRGSIADPFMNGARVPIPVEGEFLAFLRRDIASEDSHLDLERQAFDSLILLRTAQFRASGNVGERLIRALHSGDWSARGTMIYGAVDAAGEPATRFSLAGYQNGSISGTLAPWSSKFHESKPNSH